MDFPKHESPPTKEVEQGTVWLLKGMVRPHVFFKCESTATEIGARGARSWKASWKEVSTKEVVTKGFYYWSNGHKHYVSPSAIAES